MKEPGKDRRRRRVRSQFLPGLVLWLLLLLAAGPGTAWGARGLLTGFADPFFGSPNAGERALLLDRAASADAGLVRLIVPWRAIAASQPLDPANPGSPMYDFSSVDVAVRDARARGLTVLGTVQGAPDWAEGAGRPASAAAGTWKPDPSKLASFMKAVAARYSGGFDPDGPGPAAVLPAIQAIQVWNEPNLLEFLTPQYDGSTPVSPDLYRAMLNASYAAVKSVNPGMLVVTGGTSPYGGPSGKGPRLRPVDFDRRLLCMRQVRVKRSKKSKRKKRAKRKASSKVVRDPSCGAHANFDVLAHHPINTSGGPRLHAFNHDDASSADLGRITRVLRAAEKARTVTSRKHPIWATEIWWDSDPPDGAGSPLARQARWLEESLYLLWRDGANAVVNLRVRDSTAASTNLLDGSGSGIYFANEQAKPSSVAFRFPFVADRRNKRKLIVWGKAPAAGKLFIQRRARRGWTTIRKVKVRRGAVFTARLRLRGKVRLRGTVAGVRSLVWKQG